MLYINIYLYYIIIYVRVGIEKHVHNIKTTLCQIFKTIGEEMRGFKILSKRIFTFMYIYINPYIYIYGLMLYHFFVNAMKTFVCFYRER